MINAFKAMFASFELLFIALGRYVRAVDELGKMAEESAAAMADKARIERAKQLIDLDKADKRIAKVA